MMMLMIDSGVVITSIAPSVTTATLLRCAFAVVAADVHNLAIMT